MVICGAPFYFQITTAQVDGDPALGFLVEDRRHSRTTGPGATRPGFSGAALPHPHIQFERTGHLNKFGIDPIREEGVPLKLRADFFQLYGLNISDKGDAVRIAH